MKIKAMKKMWPMKTMWRKRIDKNIWGQRIDKKIWGQRSENENKSNEENVRKNELRKRFEDRGAKMKVIEEEVVQMNWQGGT